VIGSATLEQLPPGAVVEALPELHVKGRVAPVTAYLLQTLP
jgi:class 3 adenylate cyclase